MITGSCQIYQSPNVRGYIYFPPPIDDVTRLRFLIDTGAQVTAINSKDLLELGDKFQQLQYGALHSALRSADGKRIDARTIRCGIGLEHDDGTLTWFAGEFVVIQDTPGFRGNSLLGMDVLSHVRLTVDAAASLVSVNVTPQTIQLPPIGDRAP